MDIPETEQQAVSAEQIEGVPAIRAALPFLGADVVGMAHAMAGSKVKDVPVDELEFGVEDWGSFENAVDGLEAQAGAAAGRAAAAAVLGVSPDDEPAASSACTASSSPRNTRIVTRMPLSSVSTPSRRRTS